MYISCEEGRDWQDSRRSSWKLLYLILGCLATLNGIIVVLFLPDSPMTARFLSEEEKIAALERVRLDQAGTHDKHIKRYQIVETFKDIRAWIMFIIIMCIGGANGDNSASSNIITKSFGRTSRQTLLHDMPRAAIGGFAVATVGWLLGRIQDRMTVLQFAQLFQNLSAPGFPLCYGWNASNTGGHTKKVTVNPFTLLTFGVGSVVGTYIFSPKDAPGYIPGKAAIVVLTAVMMFCAAAMAWVNVRLNRKKRSVLEKMVEDNGWSEGDVEREREKAAFLDLTDRVNVFFVYTR
ncbi:MFS general substrate transporter [Acephala macrosclerotiorum]|nr:MFS general substrate transporter [Acephala macrosclerotiorum]